MYPSVVIDVETSGLPDYSKPADDPGQPRLASVAMIFLGADMAIEREFHCLIKPEGWVLEAQAAAVNGLTMERLDAEGVSVLDALSIYRGAIMDDRVVVGYNVQFDAKIMRGEFRRAGWDDMFLRTRNVCLMRGSHSAGVVKQSGSGGFPKLSDAMLHFGLEQTAQHSAFGDAHAAMLLFRKLIELDLCPEPGVHLAKKKPEGSAPKARAGKAKPPAANDELPA